MSHLCFIKALNFWSLWYSPWCQDLSDLFLPDIESRWAAGGCWDSGDGCDAIPKPRNLTKHIPCSLKLRAELWLWLWLHNPKDWFLSDFYLWLECYQCYSSFQQSCPWPWEALGCRKLKSSFCSVTEGLTGAALGALNRPQYWALKMSLV